jgi:hypothetical protein
MERTLGKKISAFGKRFRMGQIGKIQLEEGSEADKEGARVRIKKLTDDTMKAREYNIISNRYHEKHDAKLT